MKRAPHGFKVAEVANADIVNGMAAEGVHAQVLDRYATWLAAVRKLAIPTVSGAPYVASSTYHFQHRVSAFTPYMTCEFLCHGKGTLTLTIDGTADTLSVTAGSGASGTHNLAGATPQMFAIPHTLTHYDSAQNISWSFSITDHAAGQTLKVYGVRVIVFPPGPETDLP